MLDAVGAPVADHAILVAGDVVTTDADGRFDALAPASYDIVLRDPVNPSLVIAYEDMTTREPLLTMVSSAAAHFSCAHIHSDLVVAQQGRSHSVVAQVEGRLYVADSNGDIPVCWRGGSGTSTAHLRAFELEQDSSAASTSLVAHAEGDVSVTDGGTTPWPVPAWTDIAAAERSVTRVTVVSAAPTGAPTVRLLLSIDGAPASLDLPSLPDQVVALPELPGLVAGFSASSSGTEGYSIHQLLEREPGDVRLDLPAATRAIGPADGAEGISTDTSFRWEASDTAIVHMTPIVSRPDLPRYQVFASGGRAHIPAADALGIVLPPKTAYGWSSEVSSAWGSLEQAAALSWAPARLPSKDFTATETAARTFTTR